jgi:ketosteroid isomerase-like protein
VAPISGAMSVNPQRININGQGNGQVVVTLFGSNAIDAATVDVGSVRIGAVGIDTNGNDGFKSSLRDENNDGIQDLVLHFERSALVDDGQLAGGTTRLVLRAMLSDGRQIEARGTVIVGSKD